jgi:hypothetical protein
MNNPATTRALTPAEHASIAAVLADLRQHFREWSDQYASEHELIEFAIYEGCSAAEHCRTVLDRAALFALGKQLVRRDGYAWVMVELDGRWQYGLTHASLDVPIVLEAIAGGAWNGEQYDEEPDAAQIVNDSYKQLSVLTHRTAGPAR